MKQLKKTLLTLVALLAVTTGAWADETLLLTINSTDNTSFRSGSMTFDDKVTITFSSSVKNDGDNDGWYYAGSPSLLTVAGTNGYTITSCKFYTGYEGIAMTGYTVKGESPSVYLSGGYVYTDASKSVSIGASGVTKIEVYGGVASPASSGPKVAWDKAKKSGQFTMPGGNVTLEPEYYPQAALTTAPTAIDNVPATTDGAIVSAGTVANIGETTNAQGTVMYYASQTALDDAALQALAADKWTADVPTAAHLTEGQAHVYYYVRGNDSDNDDEIFSDGDILSANALTVNIAAEPLWNAEFDLTNAPEEDKAGKWSTDIPEGGVVKGTEVKVTYTGTKKVIGVKAEKKAPAVPVTAITLNKTETSIKVGATETLSVTSVLPEEATDKTYTWKTSDETKATVDQDGKVTAVAAGTVTIYAEANDGSGVKGNCTVTVTPATITVTWNNNDITGTGKSFTKDGVTITAGYIDFGDKNFMFDGTFTTTLGNFTKIEVTTGYWDASGTGWSGSTWTGNASSVLFSGDIVGAGKGNTKLVFTIEPTN